jgi:hypothetical protein
MSFRHPNLTEGDAKAGEQRTLHLYLLIEGADNPSPFSGILIWDFFTCIAFSMESNIFKHFYGVDLDDDDLPYIPDETFASAAIIMSDIIITLTAAYLQNPFAGWQFHLRFWA